jgi:flavin reductase (DIM6/NTAB) family NADH-FMN oxidoreductase RutF
MGYLDCALAAAHDHGSHTIFVAEVVAAKMENVETPLVYFNRNYRKLTGG